MKNLLFILLGTLTLQFTQAQAPNDNIGSGNCLDFDGINNNVDLGLNTSQFGGAATFSCWIFPATNDAGTVISGYLQGHNNRWDIYYNSLGNQELQFTFSEPPVQSLFSSVAVPVNRWSHISVVYNASGTSGIFINGKNAGASTTITRSLNTGVDLLISGQRLIGGGITVNEFTGQLDELQIWNRALTEVEIRDNMCKTLQGNETDLIGYWNMNEGTGNTITDLTSNGNDGTLQ